MRESIGGTWLLGLVLTFIIFFASFLALSVNYSKAFNIKNNVVDLVEKYEGNNCAARKRIAEYMKNDGFLVYGPCPSDYTGYDSNGNKIENGGRALFCIGTSNVNTTGKVPSDDDDGTPKTETIISKQYYRIIVFFKIELPIVSDLTTIRLKGETSTIYWATDNDIKTDNEKCENP